MLAGLVPLAPEDVDLADALGRVLATDLVASRDQPPFAASAMDGWAIRAVDTPGRLTIVGESAAGHGFPGSVGPGEAVRISTGAAIPHGADAVVIQEDARRDGAWVDVPRISERRHVRPAGQDFRAGQRLLTAGERLDPWRLALVAAAGAPRVSVAPRPRVAILATGDEIVAPGTVPGPFQIFNSGSTALSALATGIGAQTQVLPLVGDDLEATRAVAAQASCDILVTVGGASVGDHDLVVSPPWPAWAWSCASTGSLCGRASPPGSASSPMAAMCSAWQAIPPRSHGRGRTLSASFDSGAWCCRKRQICRNAWSSPGRPAPLPRMGRVKTGFAPAWIRGDDGVFLARAVVPRDQDSSLVAILASADALLRRRPNAPEVRPGDLVDVLPLERLS